MFQGSKALEDLFNHVTPSCDNLLKTNFAKAKSMNMPVDVMLKFIVLQAYVSGLVDLSFAEHESTNDLSRREWLEKLKLLLIPVRFELDYLFRKKQEQALDGNGSGRRHGNDRT